MSKQKLNVPTMIEESILSTTIPKSLAIVVSVMLSILILVGASGNALVCYRLRRRRDLRKVPHYLLASLSFTGFLTSLSRMPFLILTTIVNYRQVGHLPVFTILCKLGFSLSVGCMSALNALTLMGMALDRHDWCSGESARLPPMCPGFDSRTRRHMWAEFVGSLLCSERFFSGNSGFPLSSKTNIWFDLIYLIYSLPN